MLKIRLQGTAKTTTTINLGVGLARVGRRVLLVDSDPQGRLTLGIGVPKNLSVTLTSMMENIILSAADSARKVQRYIRLTELVHGLLMFVASGKIKVSPTVTLSFLTKQE